VFIENSSHAKFKKKHRKLQFIVSLEKMRIDLQIYPTGGWGVAQRIRG